MEAKPEETASFKADHQSTEYTRDADSNSFTSCFVEIIQEKSNSCMEIEQPNHHQDEHSDKAAIQFWQTQKLPTLKEEMRFMYNEGLPVYEIKPLGEDKVKELLQGIEQDIKSENNKEILIRILAEKIENSRDNQSDLAKKCKEYVDSLGTVFQELDESFYMDMICNYATLKSHLNLKINYLDHFNQNSNDYEVWEIKNSDYLKEIAEPSHINVAKAMRKWKAKALNALDRLIKAIIKMKNSEDFKKIFDLKDKYEAAIATKKPTIPEKKTPKANKRKHQNLDEVGDQEIKEIEKGSQISVKKVKITPAQGASTSTKKSQEKVSVPKSPTKETASPGSEPKSETKKGTESVKKEKKDNNQSNLMSFFKKKPEQSETKPENKVEKIVQQPSRFKCLGSLEPRSKWETDRSDAFERFFNQEVAQPSIEELLQMARQQQIVQVPVKSTRKIYISIHDSVKRIKGKYELTSNTIRGRNPLAKDEVIIDYNIESEDEIQEHNAENIDEEGRSENDESDLDEENEKDFIVPDGYVSADEKPEDVSDTEENDGKDVKKTVNANTNVQFKEDGDFKSKPKPFFFNMSDNYQAGRDMQLDDYLNKFKVIKLVDEEFPLKPKKAKAIIQAGKIKWNPEAINDDDIMKALILSLHGEFSKVDTVTQINTTFPSCSKKSIEKKLVELENSELIKKEKIPGETKARWIVQKEFFLKFGTEDDYNRLLVEKRDKEIEKQKLEKEKRETEKKLKQMTQVQTLLVPDPTKANKENQDEEIKESSNSSVTIIRKTVQTELPFGNPKLSPNVDLNDTVATNGNSSFNRQTLQIEHVLQQDTS